MSPPNHPKIVSSDDWLSDIQPWGFPCLAIRVVAKPPPGAYVQADPPEEPLQHTQRERGATATRGRRMTSLA